MKNVILLTVLSSSSGLGFSLWWNNLPLKLDEIAEERAHSDKNMTIWPFILRILENGETNTLFEMFNSKETKEKALYNTLYLRHLIMKMWWYCRSSCSP